MQREDYSDSYDRAELRLQLILNAMEDYELIELHSAMGSYPQIYSMDEYSSIYKECQEAWELSDEEMEEHVSSNFNLSNEWFMLTATDDFVSFDSLEEVPDTIDIDEMISDILREMDDYGNAEIAEVLTEMSRG